MTEIQANSSPVEALESAQWGAARTGLTYYQFLELCKRDIVPRGVHVRLGRRVMVNPKALETWIANGGQAWPGGWKKEVAA